MKLQAGDLINIDADTEEYGRVTGTAEIIDMEEVGYWNRMVGKGVVLVNAHSIRANIFVRLAECRRVKL